MRLLKFLSVRNPKHIFRLIYFFMASGLDLTCNSIDFDYFFNFGILKEFNSSNFDLYSSSMIIWCNWWTFPRIIHSYREQVSVAGRHFSVDFWTIFVEFNFPNLDSIFFYLFEHHSACNFDYSIIWHSEFRFWFSE